VAREEVDLIVSGGTLLTVDEKRRVILDGALAVRDGRILEVGERGRVESRYDAAEVLDARGKLVLPGFIDLHVHNAQSLLRGWIDDRLTALPPIWLSMLIPFEAHLEPRHVEAASWISMLGMLRSGTTCFVEAGAPWPEAVAGVAEKIGLRAIITRSNIDLSEDIPMYLETSETVRENLRLFERWDGRGRVRVWFSLRELMLDTMELYEEFRRLAEERDTYITMHLAEDRVEVDYALEKYGVRPVELMYRRGFLSPRVLASHMIYLNSRELRMLRGSGASVAWCPYVDARVMSFPRVDEMLAAGVNLGLGSDGGAWCNLDLLEQARIGRAVVKTLSNASYYDKTCLDSWEALEMITRRGGAAVHQPIGMLKPGYLADLIAIRLRAPHLLPLSNPVETLINSARGSDVEDVVVGGEVLMRGGEVLKVDEEGVLERAGETASELVDLVEGLRERVLRGAGKS